MKKLLQPSIAITIGLLFLIVTVVVAAMSASHAADQECKEYVDFGITVCITESSPEPDPEPDPDPDPDPEPEPDPDPRADLWEPGHYMLNAIEKALQHKELKGAVADIYWREAEPKKGQYDTSSMDALLNRFKKANKILFVRFQWKAFNTKARALLCAPDYIHKMKGVEIRYYDEVERFKHKGHKIWKCLAKAHTPAVKRELKRVGTDLGKHFSKHPAFGGIIFPETANDGGSPEPSQRLAMWKELSEHWNKHTPGKPLMVNTNYIAPSSNMGKLFKHFEEQGIIASGPDLMTNRYSTSQKLHGKYKGKIGLSVENQRAPLVAKSPARAWAWAKNELEVDYIFWVGNKKKEPWRFEKDILPVIRKAGPINSPCPSSLNCK